MSRNPRACILSVSGPDLLPSEANFLSDAQPWGLILMGRSCKKRDQVRRLVDDIWAALGRACLIFIDQEGGRVARLKAPEWPLFPAGAAYGALYRRDPLGGREAVKLGYRLIAHELTGMGIHADCAPVLDLPVPGAHDIVGDRAFGTTVDEITALGRAALEGLAEGGVAGVIKHMPGHGRAEADSHMELPRVTAGDNELASDFAAFEAFADAPMAMSAHIAYTALDGETPATLSQKIISQTIRGRIGFDGLLMSDDLGMQALGGTLRERAQGALSAGCDIALHCSGFISEPVEIMAEMEQVADACSPLEGKSWHRAEVANRAAGRAQPFDPEAGWARFAELMPDFSPLGAAA